ncbi:hypothetical protein [Corynebacterium silvaticum]|uniref:hypothetical protein n=1 Tax=Corynebacterium silvaticum TaxID=2320431 RepID=UPI0021D7BACA|nr:hypothetical protein [Corynebacterium silvaticum]UWH02008.1 hypothetical protein K1I38_09930 [Corynebacterium silvaticum]UXZ26208.1 hypothetical protein K3929_09935 [Corynebacterium silvaticum]UXZ28242.1 hypothetical protein K3930_09910 [Corynebacterium silvaticum]UXZ30288.1 hypothetical protein K3934_09945 [Corynebacterium silvaticum]
MGGGRGNGQIGGAAAPANHPQYTDIWHRSLAGPTLVEGVQSTSTSGLTKQLAVRRLVGVRRRRLHLSGISGPGVNRRSRVGVIVRLISVGLPMA